MAIAVIGQSAVLAPPTPTTYGVGPLTFPPGVKPGDVLFGADFLGGYAASKDGWNQYDLHPGPDPWPNNPANNRWTYPASTTLGAVGGGYAEPTWMNGYGAFWHPMKVYSGLETPSSRECERQENRGWSSGDNHDFGYGGLWVCGALRGVNNAAPVAWSASVSTTTGALTTVNGLQGYPTTYPLNVTVPGAKGKHGLWIFSVEHTPGAQQILNNLRPTTWGAFDGQVTYQTLYIGTSAAGSAFSDTVEGTAFSYANGLAVLTSPLPSDTIPACTWVLRRKDPSGAISTVGGPFGTLLLLNNAPMTMTAGPVVNGTVTVSGATGDTGVVTVTAAAPATVDPVTYANAAEWSTTVRNLPAQGVETITAVDGAASQEVSVITGLQLRDSATAHATPIRHTATGKILAIRRSA